MTQPYEPRNPGQKLVIFSTEYNDFIKTSQEAKQRTKNFTTDVPLPSSNNGIAFAKNISGQKINQYEAVVIESLLFTPSDNENAFKNQVSLNVNLFDETDVTHISADLAITLEPMDDLKVAPVMLAGTSQSFINVVDINHKFAKIVSGSFTLESAAGGPFKIVSRESGLGMLWAYLRFPLDDDVQQFKVVGLNQADSITCVPWDGFVLGSVQVEVAMPYTLRRTPFDGGSRLGINFNYSTNSKRTATINPGTADEEEQVQEILPAYDGPLDVIIARRNVIGGVEVLDQLTGLPLNWVDINNDGRQWAESDEDE